MTKYLLLLFPLLALASPIRMDYVTLKPLGQIIHTNAQINQLSYQKQEIVSLLSGHVEAFYVKEGNKVKSGDKVVLIESIALSKLTADYLALRQQVVPTEAQVTTTRKLYKKGLASKNQLNAHVLAHETLRSQKYALASQMETFGIDAKKLKKATNKLVLHAHADGIVGKILVSLHSNVDARTPLMTLVQQSGFYATAFLSPSDAMKVGADTKAWVRLADTFYDSTFVQLLPNIDEETQRAKVRFSINNSPDNLLLGAFTKMKISLPPRKDVLMVKKSGLTLFQGEWVVFVKTDTTEHKEESHESHGYDTLNDTHDAHAGHGHNEHEEEPKPYKARVVSIIAYAGDYVAINGLEVGEEYVSDGVWFVKSMLLRSSLGEHGH